MFYVLMAGVLIGVPVGFAVAHLLRPCWHSWEQWKNLQLQYSQTFAGQTTDMGTKDAQNRKCEKCGMEQRRLIKVDQS